MRATGKVISGLVMGWVLATAGTGLAQRIANTPNSFSGINLTPATVPPDSIIQLTAEAAGLALVPPAEVPFFGTFWLVEPGAGGCMAAPLPCLPFDPTLPIYAIADGQFLVDGTGGQAALNTSASGLQATRSTVAAVLAAQADAVLNLINQIQAAQFNRDMALAFGRDAEMDGPGTFSPMLADYDTNALWLEITNVSNGWSYLNLHNATNLVHAIWSTTNLLTNWQVERELWPTNPEVMPFTVPTLGRENLFLRAEDWTGKDSNGDGVPDWWLWQYFGGLNALVTNLDYSGNGHTFAEDYSNNIPPTVFKFTGAEVAKNHVSASSSSVQLDVVGYPYYVATLVDDDNFSNAVWNTYFSANVTVNLGSGEGWHEVWIGLRGHGDDASAAVWQWQRLKLDYTSPSLVITGPTNGTVKVPIIQLTGWCSEALSGISYDLTNAAGLFTNQQVLITGQAYCTNTAEFTTNDFHAYDVPLTNGVNTITIYATDLAGNVTALTTNFVYSPSTNPPVVGLLWPQDGMRICGSNFTIKGWVDDPTAKVAMTTVDVDGNTNILNGRTGRDGIFWLEDVPLSSGTKFLALTVSHFGGDTTTNFSLIPSSVALVVRAVAAGDTNVIGTIAASGYTIWVNGTQAAQDNGSWTASINPLCVGGGMVAVAAIPNSDNGGNGSGGGTGANPSSTQSLNTQATVQAPQGVFISSAHDHLFYTARAYWYAMGGFSDTKTIIDMDWQDAQGGNYYDNFDGGFPLAATSWPQSSPVDISEYYDDRVTNNHVTIYYWNGSPEEEYTYNSRTHIESEWKLATGGPLGSTQQSLWVISATATDDETGLTIPPDQIEIGSLGSLDTNGDLYVMLPDNDPTPVTPKPSWTKNYKFTVDGRSYPLAIMANDV